MPLELFLKISLIHKIKFYKANIVTINHQEASQSPFRRKNSNRRKTNREKFYKEKRASLTVEAALVFPFAFLALYGMLFFFCVLQTGLDTKGALTAAGSRLSLELTEEKEAGGRSALYFFQELGKKGAVTKWIAGGTGGIRWQGTKTEGEDVILRIQYSCKLPVKVFGIQNIPITQQVMIRKWIGQGGEGADSQAEDRWVYVTPNGSVYHESRECTHLKLSIQTATERQAKANYEPCLKCGSRQPGLCYYVTQEGDRYHTALSCSGLKRTIYLKRLSEVEGYGGCSRCCKG